MDVSKNQMYTPHLKKVLKSYQVVATNSLHGPNSVMAAWAADEKLAEATTVKEKGRKTAVSQDYDVPFVAPPPIPIQQPPIFTPPDQSRCERSETILEGETISCFVVGGEKRLCLPQILNTVLRDFSLQQINSICDELHIFCSRCNSEQLDVLKVTGILPMAAPSCGLITKTDSERLCSALLHSSPPRLDPYVAEKRTFHFDVYHECFGKCVGTYTPDWYASPFARCIECRECRGLFTPQKFVCHAHGATENRTCHWGFDSANWRAYVILVADQDRPEEELKKHLDEMKVRYDYAHKYKRKQVSNEVWDTRKKVRAEEKNLCPYPGVPLDTALAYWYSNPWSRVSAFKPWSPAIGKDGKPIFVPHTIPHYFADGLPTSVPVYLAHPMLPSEAESKSVMLNASTLSKVKKSDSKEECFSPAFDSDDTLSETSISTLSGKEEAVTTTGGGMQEQLKQEIGCLDKWLHQEKLDDTLREKIIAKVTAVINKCHFVAELQQKQTANQEEAKEPSRNHVQNATPALAQLQKYFSSQIEVAKLREQALLEEVQAYRLAAKALNDQLDVPKLSDDTLCAPSRRLADSSSHQDGGAERTVLTTSF